MYSIQFQLRFLLAIALICLHNSAQPQAQVPQAEVNALEQAVKTMGNVYWEFNATACKVERFGVTQNPPFESEANITCDCSFPANVCHIVAVVIKRHNLPGKLPPELGNLPYLRIVNIVYNYLNGSIPKEWASLPLQFLGLLGNRLTGEIPSYVWNITTLTTLELEGNQFYGRIPREIGKLVNLESVFLSSNKFDGPLPDELGTLRNMTNFRINDNNFSGRIPEFIQNWKNLTRLEIMGSGLSGPIPPSISVLEHLTDLRISDIDSPGQQFPLLGNMSGLKNLVLRNCYLTGEIPTYIWGFSQIKIVDLSFNKLVGTLPSSITNSTLKSIFLSNNLLQGDIPQAMLRPLTNVDLSYNNLTWQSPNQPVCQKNLDLNLNLYRSFSGEQNLRGVIPCVEDFKCPQQWHNLYINSGGPTVKIQRNNEVILYEGDDVVRGGAANFYLSNNTSSANWGVSSSGDFMDSGNIFNTSYIAFMLPTTLPELYQTARISPLLLTYYRYCMMNGSYTVNIHFVEGQFTNDSTYRSLGIRVFDIYIQNMLVEKDFNIEQAAGGFQNPITKSYDVFITNELLEIQFRWSGKGTTRFPVRGTYGPLVSGITVDRK